MIQPFEAFEIGRAYEDATGWHCVVSRHGIHNGEEYNQVVLSKNDNKGYASKDELIKAMFDERIWIVD